MKVFKINNDTVAAVFRNDELCRQTFPELAGKAFLSLGEKVPRHLEITAYRKENELLLFAHEKKTCFDITRFYPKVM